jgi:TRAP-type C4-dicarboxylate transport system permease small subunit
MFHRLDQSLGGTEKWVASALLALTTALACIQVFNRYLLHFEIMGIGDLYVYTYVLCLYASLAYTTKVGGHTSVEVLENFFKRRSPIASRLHGLVMQVISLLILLVFLSPVTYTLRDAVRFPEWAILVPWFNVNWLVYAMFLSLCLSVYHMLRNLYLSLADSRREPE